MRVLQAVLADSLTGVAPSVLNKFLFDPLYDSMLAGPTSFPFQSNHAKFWIKHYVPKAFYYFADASVNINRRTITITRLSIGFIIGSVLSWISMLSLPFALVFVPLMERASRLKLIEALFIIRPELKQPSLLKFALAEWKQGLFPKEDAYVRLAERL